MANNGEEIQLNEEQLNNKQLIVRNLQEVLGVEKLIKQIASGKALHVYWGTATTGRPHVGYFVPIQKIADFLRAGIRVTILFADLHAFLDNLKSDFDLLENRLLYYELVIKALMRALDVPLEKLHFVRGLSFQLNEAYTKDLLRLSSIVSLRDAVRAGAEVVKQTEDPLLSGILYPLLQALDEQHLKVDGQFGGVDQRKIFILAEEQLPRLKLGRRIHLMNPMVPGLTCSKMSSSEDCSKIDLLDEPEIVNVKIDSSSCNTKFVESDEDNGVLAFYKHVVFPILGQDIQLDAQKYSEFDCLQDAFEKGMIEEGVLKDFLKEFLNGILAKVQKNCRESTNFTEILLKAYPKIRHDLPTAKNNNNSQKKLEIFSVLGPFGDNFEFIPSKRTEQISLIADRKLGTAPLNRKVLWRCSPKGGFTLAHVYALLQLKFLQLQGFSCSILVSDLDAFLDRLKCPWVEMKKRMENHLKELKRLMTTLGISDLPVIVSADYEFKSDFTMEMYRAVSVVSRDQTALIESANTVGCHLWPIYFALDIFHANVDIVLIGPNQRSAAELSLKINKTLNKDEASPAFLIMPEIIGADGLRMSSSKPDFNIGVQDGVKKIRQKVGKSFCEPGNLEGNVALELCRKFVFPFAKYCSSERSENEFKNLTIERTPENGGDLLVENFEMLKSAFLTLKLHPADLKAFLVQHIDAFLEPFRSGKELFEHSEAIINESIADGLRQSLI